MNLNFEYLEEKLNISGLTILVMKDVRVFSKVVSGLYRYAGENDYLKFFDNRQKDLKASEMMLITDILGFELNSRQTLKLIYQDLEEQLNEKPEVKSEIERLAGEIEDLIALELVDNELDLEQDEITFQELLSALGVRIEVDSDMPFEKILEILQVYKYLSKVKLLVFVNCASYLTECELREIAEYVFLLNKEVLLVEPREVKGSGQFVLDEDYCIFEERMV